VNYVNNLAPVYELQRQGGRHRIKDIETLEGRDLQPVIADNFILVPVNKELQPMKGNKGETSDIQGDYQQGQTFEIKFEATPIL